MVKLSDFGSDVASDRPGSSRQLDVLSLDEAEQVAGGFPFLIVAIAVGCALLLKHD